jgi:eukaryotic-like serine/threonine-protein kinase
MVGKTISHYDILEKLGDGGMGVVYKARDTHLDRFIAIKVLLPERVADPDRKRRFVQEAKTASALNHPNIVHIYDIDQQDGVDYIAMEHVQGKTLDQLIPRDGMRLNEALKCAAQIADALAKANAAGIIHRDLKPGNVMVTQDERVKVLDFGLAKLTESAGIGEDASTRTVKPTTEEGKIVGTVAYMSPEQAEGKKVDARSDIFSFGSLLYEMITGRRAFQGDTRASTLAAVLRDEPKPASQITLGLSKEVERVIRRCLRKDPAHRFQHMDDLKVALEELEEESDSGKLTALEESARHRKPRFLRPALAAAALVVLTAAGVLVWQRIQAAPLTDKDVLVLADFTNNTGEAVFDDTLREALAVQLEQSPFLKILSDGQVRQDLRLMGHPTGVRITNQVAREICQREGEKAMIGGAIVSLGKNYAITLQATNCQTGETLAREQVEAGDKEHVLRAIATATSRMRAKLGESLASIQKLAVPSEPVTTTSLEAFQAYALGRRQQSLGLSLAAIPFYRRATDLDPNFAMAYNLLGVMYCNAREYARCIEYRKKAFSLVDRVSERERLAISAGFHRQAGELTKAVEQYELLARTYPRAYAPHNDLGTIYSSTGEWEKALAEYQEAARLDPRTVYPRSNQVGLYRYLGRFDEARAVAARLVAQKLDSPSTHVALLQVAYVQGDQAEAERQIQWLAGKQEEYLGIEARGWNAAVLGQYRRAIELLERGGEMARRRNLAGMVAHFQSGEAEYLALGGNCEEARDKVRAATLPDPTPSDTLERALPLAICGDATTAQKMADDTSRQYPLHMLWKAVWRPAILAAVELNRNQPERAIKLLQSACAYERAYEFVVYLRGLAYLRLRKGAEASVEFQSILDHKGANWGPYYPLSYVGLARAAELAGDIPRARKAYLDFLALWRDADPDIPILREAKQEYARLK